MNFEEYLKSKKIDSDSFMASEQSVWESWKAEFDEVGPTSFTAQKLYLINPVRRKYHLKEETIIAAKPAGLTPPPLAQPPATSANDQPPNPATPPKPVVPRPVFKPKPKMS